MQQTCIQYTVYLSLPAMDIWEISGVVFLGSLLGMGAGVFINFLTKSHNHKGEEAVFIGTTGLLLGSVSAVLLEYGLERNFTFFLFLGVGAALSWLLARGDKPSNPCCTPCLEHPTLNLLTIVSVSFCSFNDGLFIGLVQPDIFSLLFLSMLLHKFTVSFLLIHLIRFSFIKKHWKVFLIVLFLVMSPLVIIASQILVGGNKHLETPLLGTSSGILVYVMLSGLWPTVRHYHKEGKLNPYLFYGIFVGTLLLGATHFFVHLSHHP